MTTIQALSSRPGQAFTSSEHVVHSSDKRGHRGTFYGSADAVNRMRAAENEKISRSKRAAALADPRYYHHEDHGGKPTIEQLSAKPGKDFISGEGKYHASSQRGHRGTFYGSSLQVDHSRSVEQHKQADKKKAAKMGEAGFYHHTDHGGHATIEEMSAKPGEHFVSSEGRDHSKFNRGHRGTFYGSSDAIDRLRAAEAQRQADKARALNMGLSKSAQKGPGTESKKPGTCAAPHLPPPSMLDSEARYTCHPVSVGCARRVRL